MQVSHRNFIFLLGISLLGTSIMSAQPAPAGTVPVIIRFKKAPGKIEKDAVESNGGKIKKEFTIVNAVAANVTPDVKDKLKKNNLIEDVEDDVQIQATDLELDNTWGVKHIGSGLVHDSGNKGGGVKVCILDTGIQTSHPDLYLNYKGGWDFVNGDADPSDDNSHGTHVAGTVAALMNSANVRGVAPDVELYAYKILNASGGGYASSIISALQECVRIGGKVTNSSFGASSDPGLSVKQAYDNAAAAGVINVASAGNSGGGANTVGFPGQYSSVIAVAAVDSSNAWASFSSTGPAVAVAAPGVSILSTHINSSYSYKSGTSMASPHVAGVAALIVACGITSPSAVRNRLTSTALDLGPTGRDDSYGAGLVQADKAAMNCNSTSTQPSPVTDLAVSSVTAPATLLTNTNATISVAVNNVGNQTASGFSLNLTDNGTFVSSQAVPSLAAGANATVTFNWSTATAGAHTLAATLVQTDANAANNTRSAVTQVSAPVAPADISLTSISVPSSVLVSTSTTVSVGVSNVGGQTASGFSLNLSDNGVFVGSQPVPSLAAGASSTVNFTWSTTITGSHTLTATLAQADGNAANNSRSGVTQVSQPATVAPPPPAPESGITVTLSTFRNKNKRYVDVRWSGATTSWVVINRSGSSGRQITSVNDGQFTDNVSQGTYTYTVCETSSGACSSAVSVTVN